VIDGIRAVGETLDQPTRANRAGAIHLSDADANRYAIEVFFDGGCPLCRREINLLRRWDRRLRIRFTDIDNPAFRAADVGKTHDELMSRMHGRLPDGTWIEGVEVFRRLYAAIGLGPLVALSRLPVFSQFLDFGYAVFARNRLRLTGRCTAESCSKRSEVNPERP
jgi:predicted DCC family thiol-disulfide oxidoreductase YuxK